MSKISRDILVAVIGAPAVWFLGELVQSPGIFILSVLVIIGALEGAFHKPATSLVEIFVEELSGLSIGIVAVFKFYDKFGFEHLFQLTMVVFGLILVGTIAYRGIRLKRKVRKSK